MTQSRTRALLNLSWLIGLPLLLAAGLFGYGAYVGESHRAEVLEFERKYLSWSGLVPRIPPIGVDDGATGPEGDALPAVPSPPGDAQPAAQTGRAPPSAATTPGDTVVPVGAPTPAPVGAPTDAQPDSPTRALPSAATPGGVQPDGAPPSSAAPMPAPAGQFPTDGTLDDPRLVPVTVSIKVLVDERLVRARPDWLALIQRTIATASRIYRADFGIELSLSGVVRWAHALDGVGGTAMHAELRRHGREGADVLLGFVARPLDDASYALGAPSDQTPLNGGYALVGEGDDPELPHLRGVLRAVGHLMGARSVSARGSDDYQLGTWMSDARTPAGRPPWIDLANRKRILARKARPFEPESGAMR